MDLYLLYECDALGLEKDLLDLFYSFSGHASLSHYNKVI